jgi:transposase
LPPLLETVSKLFQILSVIKSGDEGKRMAYIEGAKRDQGILFPATLDDYVGENNEVRAIAEFIKYLKFDELGFERSEPAVEGRPGYDPRVLLGIYIWGHLNRMRSSRRLERECGRNVELMWLSGLLKPDFKTLCRFRQENGVAIGKVLVQFRMICEGLGLFGKELVGIDGSKFKAVNSVSRNVTEKKLAKMIERERNAVNEYLAELEIADKEDEGETRELTAAELKKKIALMDKLRRDEELMAEMKEKGESQRSFTDPDARLMKTSKGMDVCYNVQTVVDSKHKLIVEVEVTNEGTDDALLTAMARKAKKGLGVKKLKVVADGGYFSNEALKACEKARITTYLPMEESKDAERKGLFSKTLFKYDKKRDVYICPEGAEMTPRSKGTRKTQRTNWEFFLYSTNQCTGCPVREQCTTSKTGRKIRRWVDHAVLERLKKRLKRHPEMMRLRKTLVEHPFGTMKVGMGHERLLLKGIENVATEIKLTVLSYNFKRVISILGIETMIKMLETKNLAIQGA